MLSRNLLAGASLLAFAAGAANAQTGNNYQTSVQGDLNTVACPEPGILGNDRNRCSITVDGDTPVGGIEDVDGGDNNFADVDIEGDDNSATINIFGDRNTATIDQVDNSSEMNSGGGNQEDGDWNDSVIRIGGAGGADSDDNSASSIQDGDDNTSFIYIGSQAGQDPSSFNSATNEQRGDENLATISQSGSSNSALNYQLNDLSYYSTTSVAQNEAMITQDGSSNGAMNRQYGDVSPSGYQNYASITQTGSTNSASNYQDSTEATVGDTAGNTATIVQAGGGANEARNNQDNRAGVAGSVNSASIDQDGTLNYAVNNQYGDNNEVEVTQDGGYSTVSGNPNSSTVNQFGANNDASVSQTHDFAFAPFNSSTINQGAGSLSASSTGTSITSAVSVEASGNSASVTQDGAGLISIVEQNFTAAGGSNSATVDQTSGSPVGSISNYSSISQLTSSNSAWVVMNGGEGVGLDNSPDAGPNSSTITQQGGDRNEAGVFIGINERFVVPPESQVAANPDLNTSTINQNGRDNYAEITISSGTTDLDNRVINGQIQNPSFNQPGGNTSSITQTGDGSTAVVSIARARGFFGIGNELSITQNESTGNYANQTEGLNTARTGRAAESQAATTDSRGREVRPGYTEGGQFGNFIGANGQYVEVYMRGRYDSVTITQNDDAGATDGSTSASGRDYGNGQIARARAGVYTSGANSTVSLTQTGDNYADITQGQATELETTFIGQSQVTVTQVDAGDVVTPVSTPQPPICNQNVCTPQPPIITFTESRRYNAARVFQYGDFNQAEVTQNTMNGYASVYQLSNTEDNRSVVEQGTGRTALVSRTGVYENNPISPSAPSGIATSDSTAIVEQAGGDNASLVSQDGTRLYANVLQQGTGDDRTNGTDFAGFGATVGNQVVVLQQGTDNRATAIQRAGVGRSSDTDVQSGNSQQDNIDLTQDQNAQADEFYFAGGARSAEIDILQSGTGNTALVEQQGRGQYARVDQGPPNGSGSGGNNNTASILQLEGATNATAVVTQQGSNNSYYVIQDLPGQYIAVEQNGNGNAATNVVQRGDLSPNTYNSPFAPPAP